jgi:glycogen debranching enzyme
VTVPEAPGRADDGGDKSDGDQFYISASGSPLEQRTRTLKHGDTFAIFDAHGDVPEIERLAAGLYHRDTRYLSQLELRLYGERPLLLSSSIGDEDVLFTTDLTNPDVYSGARLVLAKDLIHIHRAKFLWNAACHERLTVRSYADRPQRIALEIAFGADFADLFEVRGHHRARRGDVAKQRLADGVALRYHGLDDTVRETRIRFDPVPDAFDEGSARFDITLARGARCSIFTFIGCGDRPTSERYFVGLRQAQRTRRAMLAEVPSIATSNSNFNELIRRAMADLAMLVTDTEHGPYPYAGIPWFSAPFGRDAIITALETLWLEPRLACGVLRYLAATQATAVDPASDAEPGKILHERRFGELAILGEVPFAHYYGSVDATPLFVMLAAAYFERTGDLATIRALWPHITAALEWIDRYGDPDGDGFVEYARQSNEGLVNQGWKDSHDSIFHADGSAAAGPIALCEVQGYVFAAKRGAAAMAQMLGEAHRAAALDDAADTLRERFAAAFWCEDLGTYALALDGTKRPCRVRSSNAGHALLTGIATPEHARRVGDTLTRRDSFSGWGVRTIALTEARYNPMSYHNGSVWPHDNALIALGLARYGLGNQAARLLGGLFDAALYMDMKRLPELFCGFARRPREAPTHYPVACSPQAWASAAPVALLQACLGLELDRRTNEIRFRHPILPPFLEEVALGNLALGDSRVDVVLRGRGGDVAVSVPQRRGDARVVTIS